jgi:RHS repeat-associated protein
LDGTTPTHNGGTTTGTTKVYSGAVTVGIGADVIFEALAYKSGMVDSNVTEFEANNSGGGHAIVAPLTQTTTIIFSVWDGDWAILEEYDSTGARVQGYVQGYHGLVKTLVDNIYYYQDELGSTSHIAYATGTLLESYQYDLYGKPRVYNSAGVFQPGATPVAKDLFTGQRWVPEIGLYDDRNRFMSPDLGRFLQPDPIGFKGDASNLYRYCGNDWANRSDPMGLDNDNANSGAPSPIIGPKPTSTTSQKEEEKSREQFNEARREYDAKAVEANKHLDARLQHFQTKQWIDKMFDKVQNNPNQFHDPKFIRQVVMAIAKAFLDNRIRVANSKQSYQFGNSKWITIKENGSKITYANPGNMPNLASMPRDLAHEGYHQLVDGEGLSFEREAINHAGYEMGKAFGVPDIRQYSDEWIKRTYQGMPGF